MNNTKHTIHLNTGEDAMDTPDLTEGGTPCGKRYGTKTSIGLVKRRISPTKENISIMANSMIQDKTTATQMR
jgi:hypothetical protein